ncbi:MAG: transglutaminase family protein [Parachlamydiaceae bacterium]
MNTLLFSCVIFSATCLEKPSEIKLKTLYNRLDPKSVSQHLAFYELYGQFPVGEQALRDAWRLLTNSPGDPLSFSIHEIPLSASIINALVILVNKPMDQEVILLDDETLNTLSKLSKRLHHDSLKGHQVWSEEDVCALPLNEIDVARGLFLSQFGNDRSRILSYEALIDLMALQIIARLPKKDPTAEEKIIAINHFIFDEMGFRFPPHSLYAKDIDLYTFLPSVLDSRRGVCLGVSILYLCLAQRLALTLEMITPPGHIYVRYRNGDHIINIETTARGINIESDQYLGVNTSSLQKRSVKEVIGMAHFNQASVYWQNGEYEKALLAYHKAEPYMKGDPFLKELMGYLFVLTGDQQEGEKLINEIKDIVPEYAVVKNTMAVDYLEGKVDAKGISILFKKVDENRQSLIIKKEALEETLKRYPKFRAGILSLAITWMQLHRASEALDTLKRFEILDKNEPEVHYYLAVLYFQRRDYLNSWHHLQQAEAITKDHNYDCKTLRELRRQLLACCPE